MYLQHKQEEKAKAAKNNGHEDFHNTISECLLNRLK
jgi:hypothetical protein